MIFWLWLSSGFVFLQWNPLEWSFGMILIESIILALMAFTIFNQQSNKQTNEREENTN